METPSLEASREWARLRDQGLWGPGDEWQPAGVWLLTPSGEAQADPSGKGESLILSSAAAGPGNKTGGRPILLAQLPGAVQSQFF